MKWTIKRGEALYTKEKKIWRKGRGLFFGVVLLAFCLGWTSPSRGESTDFKPDVQLSLEKMWTIDATDDDAPLIGAVRSVVIDSCGTTFILDGQLNNIVVIDLDGENYWKIGGQGEAPGEWRSASSVQLFGSDQVGVFTPMPAGVVILDKWGTPMESIDFSSSIEGDATTRGLGFGVSLPNFVLAGFWVSFDRESGLLRRKYSLRKISRSGELIHEYASKEVEWDFSNNDAVFEADFDFVHKRFAVDSHGRVILASSREEYNISVFDPSGNVICTIERPHEPEKRTPRVLEYAQKFFARSTASFPKQKKRVVYENEPAIIDIIPINSKGFLVRLGVDDSKLPDGYSAVFDVFTSEGEYLKKAGMGGQEDYILDGFVFSGFGYVLSIQNLMDSRIAALGGRGERAILGEDAGLRLTLYRISNLNELFSVE